MNKRIKVIAEQADDYADGIVDQGGRFREAYTTKFAELIINECIDIIDSCTGKVSPNDLNDLIDLFKKHFGVK